MSIVHSPPSSGGFIKAPTMTHYGSDSAINTSKASEQSDSYLNITKRRKHTLTDFPTQSSADSTEIKSMIAEIRTQQDQKFEKLTSAMATIITQNQEIQKSVDFMTSQYEGLVNKVNSLESENLKYRKQVVNLENKLQAIEKHARCSTIEIRNIPKQPNENKQMMTMFVKNIGASLGLEAQILDTEFRDIYRTKSEALVVEFTNTLRKETIISEYKKFNKTRREKKEPQFNTSQIKLSTTELRPIYISEYLTTKDRRIFYIARESVKNKELAATWTAYGKVYVKKDEGSVPVHVTEAEDLVQIIK